MKTQSEKATAREETTGPSSRGQTGTTLAEDMENKLLPLLPESAKQIARLRALINGERLPIVTVIGKYNHGKSRLLNELIGSNVFKVADKRQTTRLEAHVFGGVKWLDAPGLDADVNSEDDSLALCGVWREADIRLFVHAAKEGELDVKERELLSELLADDTVTQRRTLFVLSLIDQLPSEEDLQIVIQTIRMQAPDVVLHATSSTRYRQGLECKKNLLVERSGMPALNGTLKEVLSQVQEAREHEIGILLRELEQQLERIQDRQYKALDSLRHKQERLTKEFESGLEAVLNNVHRQLEEV